MIWSWARKSVLGFAVTLAASIPAFARQADLVITGGTIRTMDASQPVVDSIAIIGNEIVATGSAAKIGELVNVQTKIIRLEPGQIAIPGLIESHGHFLGLGESLMMLDLAGAKKWDDIVEQVREASETAPPGSWIIGRGWHQSKWSEAPAGSIGGYPDSRGLDMAAPNNPVLLTHASGHMSIANGYAMRLSGMDTNSQPPAGGELLRREDGELSGVLRETAQGMVQRALAQDSAKMTAEESMAKLERAVQLAGEECWKNGITSFHDAGSSVSSTRQLQRMAMQHRLPVRLYVMVRDSPEMIRERISLVKSIGLGDEFFTCRSLKRSIDGALGPHGAWLLAPYADLTGSSGLNTDSVEVVRQTAELAAENGLQMCVHAIGDRANREVLDMYEELINKKTLRGDHRWRIEHAQHVHPDDIKRFGELGVIAAMQGVHCTSDAIFVLQRLGALRAEQGAYVWRSLLDSGAVICNGTDVPVERIDPIASITACVTRRLADGATFFPEQCMTREETLRSYTIDAAWAAFDETRKGSLVPGKLADITILSRDIIDCSDDDLPKTKVVQTIIGGKVVFEDKDGG